MKIEPQHIKAARQLIGWSQLKLALEANVSMEALMRLETKKSTPRESTLKKLQTALEVAGVEFFSQGGCGTGVRLRTPT